MSAPEVVVVPDVAALADAGAARIEKVALAGPAADADTVNVALAGGATPKAAYQRLAARCPPWRRFAFFFGDERCVPPDDAGSNFRMARLALFDKTPLREEQVHRIRGELAPDEAARAGEEDLRANVPGEPWPVFDLVVLGMGSDGHTASLFPGAPELEEATRAMVSAHRPDLPQPWRVTMTLPVLNAARRVLFMVADPAKAEVAARAVRGDPGVPAGRVRPAGELTWLLTEEAAARL